ncbi:GTP cyclohydrolase II [Bacillus thuringiensis]|uniref:GTP cyclohydrolase II n=1 Tax=Bacillus thuringiensis TaxID=1428 RepID=UPI000CD9C171|nr:GTP cyclohydrolase II [Bacillus thuringiensis]
MDAKTLSYIEGFYNLIKYNVQENILCFGPIDLPLKIQKECLPFKWYVWTMIPTNIVDSNEITQYITKKENANLQYSSVLVYGDFKNSKEALVRLHSICQTGDIFHSDKCDCGSQLDQAFQKIILSQSGAIFYLADHEGRGIGLFNKALTYALQQNSFDTLEANVMLGFPEDNRDYSKSAAVLKFLRSKPVKLLTNNPIKTSELLTNNIEICEVIPIYGDFSVNNYKYLKTKVEKFDHSFFMGAFE